MADSACCDVADSSDEEVQNIRPRADPSKPGTGKAKKVDETATGDAKDGKDEKVTNGTSTETGATPGQDTSASESAADDIRKLYLEIAHRKITEEIARLGGKIPGETAGSMAMVAPPPPSSSTKRPTASPSSSPSKPEETSGETAPPRVRASKLEFRRLDEL